MRQESKAGGATDCNQQRKRKHIPTQMQMQSVVSDARATMFGAIRKAMQCSADQTGACHYDEIEVRKRSDAERVSANGAESRKLRCASALDRKAKESLCRMIVASWW